MMSAVRRNRKGSVSEVVYQTIKERILSRQIRPGTFLLQEEVAADFGVSRTPVRDAFSQLENDKLIRMIPRKGALVLDVSLADVKEIFEIRCLCEGYAARKAAENFSVEQIGELERLTDRVQRACQSGDTEEFFSLDRQFHDLIDSASQNKRLVDIVNNLKDQSSAPRLRCTYAAAKLEAAADFYVQLLAAIKRRDGSEAERLMQEHIKGFLQRVLRDS